MIEILRQSFSDAWSETLEAAPRIAAALVTLVLAFLVARLLARAVAKLLDRSGLSPTHKSFFRRATLWLVVLVGIALALNVLGLGSVAGGLLAGGGITAVLVGFAFREIGENLLAGLLLAFSRPFELGDLIESEGLEGKVRGIELRYTHIRTPDGRDIYIPNAQIYKNPLVNYTRDGLLRGTFKIGIDYRDDAGRAEALLLETVRGVDGVLEQPRPVVEIADAADGWIVLQVFFWVDTFDGPGRTRVKSRAIEACRRAFLEAGFTPSSEVTTAVEFASGGPLRVTVADARGEDEGG